MLKEIFFICLRSAIGFVLIAPVFIFASRSGHLPDTSFTAPDDPVYLWFFNGTLGMWILGSLLSLVLLLNIVHGKLRPLFALAPIYLPLLYALLTYLWFFRDQIL